MQRPTSHRDFVAGPTGSGKTHLLRQWLEPHPRQLVLDATGEWMDDGAEFNGEHVLTDNFGQLATALADVAEAERWRVVLPVERVDLKKLVAFLTPTNAGRESYPRAVNGMALVVDEAYEVASHDKISVSRPLWLRSRHHGLSVLAASQRAADVGRAVTSMSGRIAVTATGEPIDVAYWRKWMKEDWYAAFLALKPRQAILIRREEGTAAVITTAGKTIRDL